MHVTQAQLFRRASIIAASAVLLTPPLLSHTAAVAAAGDLKVHNQGTDPDNNENDPHVCGPNKPAEAFYFEVFNFTSGNKVVWSLSVQGGANNGDQVGPAYTAFPSTVTADGRATSGLISTIPDGHYKVTAYEFAPQASDVPPSGAHDETKVFWVDCAVAPTPTPTPTPVVPTPTPVVPTPTPVVPTPTPVVPTPTPVVPTPTPVVPTPTPVVPTPTPVVPTPTPVVPTPTPTPEVGGVVNPTPTPTPDQEVGGVVKPSPTPKPHKPACPADEAGVNSVQAQHCPAVEGEIIPPADDDSGTTPVGGVQTGGGALASGTSSPVGANSVAWMVLIGMGGWSAAERLRRRKN